MEARTEVPFDGAQGRLAGRKCVAMRRDGLPCKGTAGASGFCGFHDPAAAGRLRVGRRKGAVMSNTKRGTPQLSESPTAADWLRALAYACNQHLPKAGDARSAGVVIRSVAAGLQALMAGELERRVAELERRAGVTQ